MKRILATLITTIALALGMTAYAGAPSQAEVSGRTVSSADKPAAAAVKRKVTIKFKAAANGQSFQLTGRINPKGSCANNKKVNLQRSATKTGTYRILRSGRTNGSGGYGFYGLKQTGFYRVVAPKQFKCNYAASSVIQVTRG